MSTIALISLIEFACRRLPVLESDGIVRTLTGVEEFGIRRREAAPYAQVSDEASAYSPASSLIRLPPSDSPDFANSISIVTAASTAGISNAKTATVPTTASGIGYLSSFFPYAAGSNYLGVVNTESPLSTTSTEATEAMMIRPFAASSNYLGFVNSTSSISTTSTESISMKTPAGSNYLGFVNSESSISTTFTEGISMITTVNIVTNSPEESSVATVVTPSVSIAYHVPPSNYLTFTTPATPTTAASAKPTDNLPIDNSPLKIYTFQSPSASATPTFTVLVAPANDFSIHISPWPTDQSASASAYLSLATNTEHLVQASADGFASESNDRSNHLPIVTSNNAKAATVTLPIVTTVGGTGRKSAVAWTLATTAGPSYIPASEFSNFGGTTMFVAGKSLLFENAATAATDQSGTVHGLPYNIENGLLYIDRKTYNIAKPTTTTLSGGGVLVVNPTSEIYVSLIPETTPKVTPLQTGLVNGMQYTVANGRLYVGDKTIDTALPTTATLSGGDVLVVNPTSGIYVSLLPETPPKATPIQTGVVNGVQYSVGSGRLYIGEKTIDMASPTTATLSGGGVLVVDPTGGASVQIPANASGQAEHDRHYGVTEHQYIIGAFVPTILAVLFAIPWNLLASALQEMEPFYQLHNPEGVAASESLLLDYQNSINVAATVNAFRNGHFLVWCSGLISLMVPLLAPLASETVFIGFVGEGKYTATSGSQACKPRLSVYSVAARVVQSILALIAVLTISLAIAMARKKSGVYSNPLSIASVAALLQNKDVVEEFRRLNPHITDKRTLMAALGCQSYKIGVYETEEGGSSYGLLIWKQNPDSIAKDGRTQNQGGKKYTSITVKDVDETSPPRSKPRATSTSLLTHQASVMIYGILVAGLLALVIYYNQTGGDTPFERFMDSQSLGVTFLFTAVGVGIEMYWALLDGELRAQEPYRQVLHHAAPAQTSILLAPPSNPFTGLFHSLRHDHFFNASTSLIAFLCQPLIVALANIPFKASLAFSAYRACTYIAIAILSLMLLGVVGMLCRKGMSGLAARRPDTIAGVMVLLCGSRMLGNFEGMGMMGREERNNVVRGWGKVYSMGMVVGLDGVEREGIDEAVFVEDVEDK